MSVESSNTFQSATSKVIYVIEDDFAILDALNILLTREKYTVTSSLNGSEIFSGGFLQPDLFLVDRQLPGVDGLDICRHLKKNTGTSEIPVIILSASPHVKNHALHAGASAFIEKPFSNKNMLDLIRAFL